MTTTTISTRSAEGIETAYVYRRATKNRTATNAPAGVYVISSWLQHGTQPQYWSETWLRKEKLADWDFMAGNTFEAEDVEDMIRRLHEAAGA